MTNFKIPIITLLLLFVGTNISFSQSSWEPQKNITGYLSTEFNYFDELEDYSYNYGAALSEAGLLMSYRPTSKITLKGVFVYRPDFEFDKMLNEASGEYSFTSSLNVKAGRFLQSLSPMNTFYYAPVNTSATLPIIVSNNEFFPLNINGISVNGSIGNDFRVKYDLFGGSYSNDLFKRTGALGFFGSEINYFNKILGNDPISLGDFNNMAVGGTVGLSYKTNVDVGFGFFNPNNEKTTFSMAGPDGEIQEMILEMEKLTYGVNFKLQYNATKLVGEAWTADMKLKDIPGNFDYSSYYVELSHRINDITPYARYEDQTAGDIEYTRITGGINYKPTFETTFKLEYLSYQHDAADVNGLVAAFIYSF